MPAGSRSLYHSLYGRVCGRELGANLLHFQYLAAYYARRDIVRDGTRLSGRLLDLGCGNQPYRPYVTKVVEYVGLDYPPTQGGLEISSRPEVYGDARELPFAPASFDGVLCFQVLEHVDRPEVVLQEVWRVLKPGALGLISVPLFYNLHMEPYDYFRYTPYGFRSLAERQGLKVKEVRGQGGIAALLVQMFHNWLFSGLVRLARRQTLVGALLALLLPFLLVLTVLNNLAALALDRLHRKDMRFTPNLWVVVEKPAGPEPSPNN